ncbi:hypothetical protein [Streptomyces sp. NPDC056227]|uniref:hypothetical protein n=1 Tax=Streptomyces sp. NPDC056227 TaxID=3345753 RepID=UPI0035E0D9DE
MPATSTAEVNDGPRENERGDISSADGDEVAGGAPRHSMRKWVASSLVIPQQSALRGAGTIAMSSTETGERCVRCRLRAVKLRT